MRFLKNLLQVFFGPRLVIPAHRLQAEETEGADIKLFQQILNRKGRRYGIRVPVTGIYDKETRTAVSQFQVQCLDIMNADGFVGPQTARKLRIRLLGDD